MDTKTPPPSQPIPGIIDAPRVGTLAALLLSGMLCLAPAIHALPVSGATLHLPPEDISPPDPPDRAGRARLLFDEFAADLASFALGPVTGPGGDTTRHGKRRSKPMQGLFAPGPSTAIMPTQPWSPREFDDSPWPARGLHGHAGIWPWKAGKGVGPDHYGHPPWDADLFCKPPIHPPPVPEVETWAMMLAGLGLIGLQLRRRTGKGPRVIG